jgi:hypothetical protein
MTRSNVVKKPQFKHLFDLELKFQWDMPPITTREAGEGEYIGSGGGTVEGSRIQGTVNWDLHEKQEKTLCRSSLGGVIKTNDGAEIRFDSRGFYIRPDESIPNKWITSASVCFDTADRRYAWLNTQLAIWEGEFDMETYLHHYQVYV